MAKTLSSQHRTRGYALQTTEIYRCFARNVDSILTIRSNSNRFVAMARDANLDYVAPSLENQNETSLLVRILRVNFAVDNSVSYTQFFFRLLAASFQSRRCLLDRDCCFRNATKRLIFEICRCVFRAQRRFSSIRDSILMIRSNSNEFVTMARDASLTTPSLENQNEISSLVRILRINLAIDNFVSCTL